MSFFLFCCSHIFVILCYVVPLINDPFSFSWTYLSYIDENVVTVCTFHYVYKLKSIANKKITVKYICLCSFVLSPVQGTCYNNKAAVDISDNCCKYLKHHLIASVSTVNKYLFAHRMWHVDKSVLSVFRKLLTINFLYVRQISWAFS